MSGLIAFHCDHLVGIGDRAGCLAFSLFLTFMVKVYKTFGSHNGFLAQSMHHSENTKINLITMIKQRRVLLANSETAVSQR